MIFTISPEFPIRYDGLAETIGLTIAAWYGTYCSRTHRIRCRFSFYRMSQRWLIGVKEQLVSVRKAFSGWHSLIHQNSAAAERVSHYGGFIDEFCHPHPT